MTLRHLQVFLTVYKENSITEAAKKLFISQPAVSIAIKELETHFSVRLFERVSRKLYVTAHGECFYEYACRILSEYQLLEEHFSEQGRPSILRVGCGIAVGKLIMPAIARRLADTNKDIDLRVTVNTSPMIESMLENMELDVAIIESTAPQSGRLERLVLQANPLVVICHKDSPLARSQNLTVMDLAQERLLMREKNSDTRDMVEQAFSQYGIQIQPVWESVSAMALINAVGYGLGISVLPLNYVTALRNDNIVVLRVEGIDLGRFIHIVYLKKRPITDDMIKFIELCQNCVMDM